MSSKNKVGLAPLLVAVTTIAVLLLLAPTQASARGRFPTEGNAAIELPSEASTAAILLTSFKGGSCDFDGCIPGSYCGDGCECINFDMSFEMCCCY